MEGGGSASKAAPTEVRANRSHSCQLNASKAEAAILFWSMNELASSLDLTMLSNFLTITLVQDTSCHYD